MQMGLTNIPAIFMQTLNNLFMDILEKLLKDAMVGFFSIQTVFFMLWVDLYRAWT